MTSSPPKDLSSVASETKRIITAHSLHFTALSLLFLLPRYLVTAAYSVLISLLLRRFPSLPGSAGRGGNPPPALYLIIAGTSIFSFVYEILAVGSITHSVIQAFHGRPVKLIPTVKSTFRSFFLRLSLTQLIVNLAIWLVATLLNSLLALAVGGLGIDPNSPYFITIVVIQSAVSISIQLCIRVNWALASAVVVVESESGFSALKRSSYLVKGKWPAVLCFVLSNALVMWLSALACSAASTAAEAEIDGGGWKNALLLVALSALTLTILTLFSLCFFVGETLLYLYCKAARGEELASESLPLIAP